ncbi:DUF427 domain-containing protein [Thermomonospora catenispora]|uniref:DUF427 domain-containing protein n=1 Tax=Thermomonospora catenispora TaxID=2493090 RepID=UPI001120D9EA|nr:DUF427 domain-containing protein [Thermomonospora catenispora]TNY38043.1 DUF427 domain-containing protein [Thermomonospora catenispora]
MTDRDRERGIRIEPSRKRVRVYLGGEAVVDTVRPMLVWETPHYPTYYFPVEDVRRECLFPDGEVERSPGLGKGESYTVRVNGAEARGAALRHPRSPVEELRGLVRFDLEAMQAWFEEDEEMLAHPRDPYHRVDVLASSRHVRIEVDGVTVAESSQPRLLFETGLPVRYYLPKPHVRMDLLEPSDTTTACPYKGRAEYWSVRIGETLHKDLAWSYPQPLPESQKIAGLIAFYDEKVDVHVDGVRQERPASPFG